MRLHRLHTALYLLGIFATLLISRSVIAQQPEMTMAIFANHTLQPQEWPELEAALIAEHSRNEAEMPGIGVYALRVVQGDQITVGISVERSITVSLIGNCFSMPAASVEGHPTIGVLGWVERRRGMPIEPFIYVECNHILQLLKPRIATMNREQQRRVIAVAMARVILHEWNHIETQSSHHKERGLTKSAFTADDLMSQPDSVTARLSHMKQRDGIRGMR